MKIKCLPGNKINPFGTIPVSMLLSVTQWGKAGARPNTWLRAEPNMLFPSAVVYICLGLSQLLCLALLQRFIISSNLWFNLINSVQLYSAKSQQHCSQNTEQPTSSTEPRHDSLNRPSNTSRSDHSSETSWILGIRWVHLDRRRKTKVHLWRQTWHMIKSEAWCRWSQTVD